MSEAGKNLSKDPWSTCSSCRFWKAEDNEVDGVCLRRAPVLIDRDTPRPWAVWPLTTHNDVCGDFAFEVDSPRFETNVP